MYLTKINATPTAGDFDWTGYFAARRDAAMLDNPALPFGSAASPGAAGLLDGLDCRALLDSVRALMREDHAALTMSLTRVLRGLLRDAAIAAPRIVELGAATGYLSRWLLHRYGGRATLVDNDAGSYAAYCATEDAAKAHIDYVQRDLFAVELPPQFDLACSFGLIEHFVDKTEVLAAHRRLLAPGGHALIIVPLDTVLTRVFYEVHPEQNLGYRELLSLSEFRTVLTAAGFEVLGTRVSEGFAYDYAAALCK